MRNAISMDAAAYPRWEHAGPVSRFLIGPDFAFYEVKHLPLIGGSLESPPPPLLSGLTLTCEGSPFSVRSGAFTPP